MSLRVAASYLMCPAVAFRKLGRPHASCARLPRALCALMKRLNRPRDAKRSSSAVIVSCRAAGFPPVSVRGVAAPLLLLASSLPPTHHLSSCVKSHPSCCAFPDAVPSAGLGHLHNLPDEHVVTSNHELLKVPASDAAHPSTLKPSRSLLVRSLRQLICAKGDVAVRMRTS